MEAYIKILTIILVQDILSKHKNLFPVSKWKNSGGAKLLLQRNSFMYKLYVFPVSPIVSPFIQVNTRLLC